MIDRPRALDLFCGQGGTSMGLRRAGFDVTGVDRDPQPLYPFRFVQADATTYPLDGFDVVVAGPPCQDHSSMRAVTSSDHGTAWMLRATIDRFVASGLPYLVENVVGARAQMPGAFMLCGRSFGLSPLQRHRLFLTNVAVLVPPCACDGTPAVGVYGELRKKDRRTSGKSGGAPRVRAGVEHARRLLGCPWMDAAGLSQAIPPVYTEHIGGFLLDHVRAAAVS